MRPFPILRVLAGLVVAAGVLLPSAPVAAAPRATPDVLVKDNTLAPSGSFNLLNAFLFADRPIAAPQVGLRFQLSGKVPGLQLQEAGHPNNCRIPQPDDLTNLVCGVEPGTIGPNGVDSGVIGYVGATTSAVPGSVDTLTVTMTIPGFAPVVRTSRVRVGETVDLKTPFDMPGASARPGGPFDARLTVTNNGSRQIRGTAISTFSQWSFQSRIQYRNCWYVAEQVTGCTFAETLEPGTSYRLTLPYLLRGDTAAPSDTFSSFVWMTSAEFDDLRSFIRRGGFTPLGTPGTGGALRLERVPTTRAVDPPQADPYDNNSAGMMVTATGVQGSDLAAVGDRASGRAGAVVTVSVGLRNRGPATIDRTRTPGEVPAAVVVIPTGTTAVGVPSDCYPLDADGRPDVTRPGVAGLARYFCRRDYLIIAGRDSILDFRLRIDRVVADARGSVTLAAFRSDLVRTDNSAAIVINPSHGTAPGDGGGTDNGGTGSGGGTGGGGLAITGPRSAVAGGIGALLIGVGVLCLLVARRRTRFET